MLSVLRDDPAQAAGKTADAAASPAGGPDFAQVLKQSIDKVNATQVEAHGMAENLPPAIPRRISTRSAIALQTASISFQEMVQVRNKLRRPTRKS